MLYDLTTCYYIESAWFQRLKLEYDKPLSTFAFNLSLRRYNMAPLAPDLVTLLKRGGHFVVGLTTHQKRHVLTVSLFGFVLVLILFRFPSSAVNSPTALSLSLQAVLRLGLSESPSVLSLSLSLSRAMRMKILTVIPVLIICGQVFMWI